jgi:hypothetical protein
MATQKAHRPTLKNPASPHAKKPAARKNTAVAKKNSAAAGRPAAKRKPVRRNPSPGANLLLFSIGGVVAVKGFDLLVRYLVPTLAAPITIIGMGAAAFGVHTWGKKYLGSWADVVAGGLAIFAVARAWDEWVNPKLPAAFQVGANPAMQVVQTQTIQDPATQAVGQRLYFRNGDVADVYDQANAYAS